MSDANFKEFLRNFAKLNELFPISKLVERGCVYFKLGDEDEMKAKAKELREIGFEVSEYIDVPSGHYASYYPIEYVVIAKLPKELDNE